MSRSLRRVALAMLAGLLATVPILAVAGCGSDEPEQPARVTLVLDFVPNAVHAGIYRAVAAGYYVDEGIELRIVEPGETTDSLKLVSGGAADIGIADPTDIVSGRGQGLDLGAVMAILQRSAGGLITLKDSEFMRPADFEGHRIGVTGAPSDEAVLRTLVNSDDGDFEAVDTTTIGFRGVQALAAGRLDGFIGFIAADGAQLEADGFPVRSFPLDEYGGPTYPGLVAFTSSEFAAESPELLAGFVEATVRGYADTVENPSQSLDDLIEQNTGLDRELSSRILDLYLPSFSDADGEVGELDTDGLAALIGWLSDNELLAEPVEAEDLVIGQ